MRIYGTRLPGQEYNIKPVKDATMLKTHSSFKSWTKLCPVCGKEILFRGFWKDYAYKKRVGKEWLYFCSERCQRK